MLLFIVGRGLAPANHVAIKEMQKAPNWFGAFLYLYYSIKIEEVQDL